MLLNAGVVLEWQEKAEEILNQSRKALATKLRIKWFA